MEEEKVKKQKGKEEERRFYNKYKVMSDSILTFSLFCSLPFSIVHIYIWRTRE